MCSSSKKTIQQQHHRMKKALSHEVANTLLLLCLFIMI